MKKKKVQTTKIQNKKPSKFLISKIIYFDKETISNILQEYYKGNKKTVVNSSDSGSVRVSSNIEAEAEMKLSIPLTARVKFLFSSKISADYISMIDKTVTVTSTELSDFEKIKKQFKEFRDVTVSDIENSSTFFRVAGNYIRILKGGVKDVDAKEFKSVMDGYEGYDHYKIDDVTYIRFNASAFLSNYKRNDLLNSQLQLYCICVGSFSKNDFNFIEQLNKMQRLSNSTVVQTLADSHPSLEKNNIEKDTNKEDILAQNNDVLLYDVVYASISHKESNNEKN